jgi:hypothetical protein
MYGIVRKINVKTNEVTTVCNNVEFPSSVDRNDHTGVIYVSEFHLGYISRIDPKIKDPLRSKRVLAAMPPATDNVAVMSGPTPRIFGSSFIDDCLFECFENGDPIRVIARGGMLPCAIQVVKGPKGDRIFIKDPLRVREYFPAEDRYFTLANGNFWAYAQDKAFDRGVKRYDPKRINWTASVEDHSYLPMGKIMQPTAEGHLLVGGALFEGFSNRLAIFDVENKKALRIVKDLDFVQDAIMVGKDIYMIEGKPTTEGWGANWGTGHPKGSAGYHIMKGKNTEWPIAAHITRISPDDKRETVFTGKGFANFARNDDVAFASDQLAGIIYQVVKNGKWLKQPIVLVSGLDGPTGMTIGNDGNLLVMENGKEFYNGRMLKVDLETKKVTVLADGLGVNREGEKRNWRVLFPTAAVAQASDGTVYITEPGITSFSVLRPQP